MRGDNLGCKREKLAAPDVGFLIYRGSFLCSCLKGVKAVPV